MSPERPGVALVHDYLNQRGGAERVVAELHRIWPQAPIYTSLYRPRSTFGDFAGAEVTTSFLDRAPIDSGFRALLPLFPLAFRTLGPIDAEVVISSSSGWAHAVMARPGARHIVYCHTPARWLWTSDYATSRIPRGVRGPLLSALRQWDRGAARRPDLYLANSRTTQERIRRAYGREAEIVHPPVNTDGLTPSPRGSRLLSLGRLLPYKRVDLAVKAAHELGTGLDVVGTGPELERLRSLAGPTVEFHGSVDDATVKELLQNCSALCFLGREDFGIAPVEAMAAGKPVVAFGQGGALETVRDGVTGVLFAEQSLAQVVDAIRRAERLETSPEQLAAHAAGFSRARFAARMRELVAEAAKKPR